jgi:DNA primase small subunit
LENKKKARRANINRASFPYFPWAEIWHTISRSLELLKDHFLHDVLEQQDPWRDAARAERLLQLLPDRALNDALRKKWDACQHSSRASASKWADIDALARAGASRALDARALLEAKQDVVLECTYPRLDVEVSKKLIHLLKSPFAVHPGTGRVCVPVDARTPEAFDPLAVPTAAQLLGEIDAWDAQHAQDAQGSPAGTAAAGAAATAAAAADGKRLQDYEKTSLRPYVEYLKAFAQGVMRDEASEAKRERQAEKGGDAMEF